MRKNSIQWSLTMCGHQIVFFHVFLHSNSNLNIQATLKHFKKMIRITTPFSVYSAHTHFRIVLPLNRQIATYKSMSKCLGEYPRKQSTVLSECKQKEIGCISQYWMIHALCLKFLFSQGC